MFGRQCLNCGIKTTMKWWRGRGYKVYCNGCWTFFKACGGHRNPPMIGELRCRNCNIIPGVSGDSNWMLAFNWSWNCNPCADLIREYVRKTGGTLREEPKLVERRTTTTTTTTTTIKFKRKKKKKKKVQIQFFEQLKKDVPIWAPTTTRKYNPSHRDHEKEVFVLSSDSDSEEIEIKRIETNEIRTILKKKPKKKKKRKNRFFKLTIEGDVPVKPKKKKKKRKNQFFKLSEFFKDVPVVVKISSRTPKRKKKRKNQFYKLFTEDVPVKPKKKKHVKKKKKKKYVPNDYKLPFSNKTKPVEKICMDCGTKKTPQWRHDEFWSSLCNACGLWYSRHEKTHIPKSLLEKRKVKEENLINKPIEESLVNNAIKESLIDKEQRQIQEFYKTLPKNEDNEQDDGDDEDGDPIVHRMSRKSRKSRKRKRKNSDPNQTEKGKPLRKRRKVTRLMTVG